mgnify:CR=1 FL=1
MNLQSFISAAARKSNLVYFNFIANSHLGEVEIGAERLKLNYFM